MPTSISSNTKVLWVALLNTVLKAKAIRANSPPEATLCNGNNASPVLAENNSSMRLAPNGDKVSVPSMTNSSFAFGIPN